MARVTHIDAEYVSARTKQARDNRTVGGGWAQRPDNFAATKPTHARLLEVETNLARIMRCDRLICLTRMHLNAKTPHLPATIR
jgi:hypothetical protein